MNADDLILVPALPEILDLTCCRSSGGGVPSSCDGSLSEDGAGLPNTSASVAVDVRDIAAVAGVALTEQGHDGKTRLWDLQP